MSNSPFIVYIHGANSTHETFNHIREHIGGDDFAFDYSSQKGFFENLKQMIDTIGLIGDRQLFLVAHSLGGLYALHLYNQFKERVAGAVTISTPFGGSELANVAKLFMHHNQLIKDIGTLSEPVASSKKIAITCPWTNIVTTVGNAPWVPGANDGVVTLSSMRKRKDMELVEIPINHYEVVLHPQTIEVVRSRIEKVASSG